jgi:hypothetical protein
MRRAKCVGAVLVSVAAVVLSSVALAQGSPKVKIRGVIAPPQVSSPVNLAITVYPAEQDASGNYIAPRGGVQNRTVYYDPKSMGRPQDFELELELLKEYEIRVEMLDANGDPLKDRTYYFADVTTEKPEGRASLRLDMPVSVPLSFRWETRSANKGNFIQPIPAGSGFVLTHYINPATVPGT